MLTCLHSYSRNYFVDHLLKEFLVKMEGLPLQLGITTKIALEEYRQTECSLPCPICLYNNFVADESNHLTRDEGNQPTSWNV